MKKQSVVSNILEAFIKASGKKALRTNPVTPAIKGRFDYLKKAHSQKFTAGFGKSVMLPPDIEKKKYYIAGYGENNPAKGVIDPQYAHALWLDDNSGRGGVLFVSLDAVGLLNKDVNEAKRRLSDFTKETGCRSINIFCTHNHAGIDTMGIWGRLPLSGKDPEFMEILFSAIVKAAKTAFKTRKEGDLFLGTAEVPDMQEDIRTPVVYSKTLTRFRFVPDNGENEIWLLNFASHSESLQGCNHLVSADFPCYMRRRIKEAANADVVYGVGAIGGMISMKIENEDVLKKEHRLLESTEKIGEKLADYALSISNDEKLSPVINFIRSEFFVEADNPVLALACNIGIISADKYGDRDSSKGFSLKTELTYFEIGSKKMLFLPCEIFPELVFGGFLTKDESATGFGEEVNPPLISKIVGDDSILVFGLANDELGYVLPPNDFLLNEEKPYLEKAFDRHGRRHYEETNSLGPKTAGTVAEAVLEAVRIVNETKEKNKNL